MKYIIVLCDGMADLPLKEINNKTPMEKALKPNMDMMALKGTAGLVKTVPDNLSPGSDVANLSVLGYDPNTYYSGRSPLEAASIGVNLLPSDVALRCNFVTLSKDEPYFNKYMLDYCADDISTEEATILIKYIEEKLGNQIFKFYSGFSYRHCMVWDNGLLDVNLTPPHDIINKKIENYLSNDINSKSLIELMKKSYDLLKDHPVNLERIKNGKHPANSIWLWGQGKKPALDSFYDKFGLKGSIVSAVDLIKGIGICADMNIAAVDGATGYIDTNFEGKTDALLKELKDGQDFVYLHIEAPDECGHRGEINNKIKSIEYIDSRVLTTLLSELDIYDDYKIMILPDHPTPLSTRTHSRDAVPFLIYQKNVQADSGVSSFSEKSCESTGIFFKSGPDLMEFFLKK